MNIYKPVLIGAICASFLTTTFAASKAEIAIWINEVGNRLIHGSAGLEEYIFSMSVAENCSYSIKIKRKINPQSFQYNGSFSYLMVSRGAVPTNIILKPQQEISVIEISKTGFRETRMSDYINPIVTINPESRERLFSAFEAMANACGSAKMNSNLF